MQRDLEFLYELGALRYMPRQWSRFHMPEMANNSEHMFRVTWIALVIAAREGKKVDTGKIVKMAIAHDIAESRTGDVDYISRQYVERDELGSISDMLADTAVEEEFLGLIHEYEERKTLESQIVKDADNIDCDMELYEQAENGVKFIEHIKKVRDTVAANKLYTETARKMYAELKKTGPHDWHVNSPKNRLLGGDWKKK